MDVEESTHGASGPRRYRDVSRVGSTVVVPVVVERSRPYLRKRTTILFQSLGNVPYIPGDYLDPGRSTSSVRGIDDVNQYEPRNVKKLTWFKYGYDQGEGPYELVGPVENVEEKR